MNLESNVFVCSTLSLSHFPCCSSCVVSKLETVKCKDPMLPSIKGGRYLPVVELLMRCVTVSPII